MTKYIPNILTSFNLVCGVLSILFVMSGQQAIAAYLVFIAAFFDFTDGFAARILNAYSDLGKQLDSLADLISFGVAPGMILLHEILNAGNLSIRNMTWGSLSAGQVFLFSAPFFVILASAFRLAKFNIDTEQTSEFRGLPTPASGLFFASIPLVRYSDMFISKNTLFNEPVFFLILSVLFAFLMVSDIPMLSLKIKNIKATKNIPVFILLILSIILLLMFSLKAVFAIIILYIFISLFLLLFPKKALK